MVKADVTLVDYDTVVCVRLGDRGFQFCLPPSLVIGGVGNADVALVIHRIHDAFQKLDACRSA